MKYMIYLTIGTCLVGCAPKVYVIDHHTVFEEEASGSWPDLDQKYLQIKKKKTATLLKKNEKSQKQERLTSVLYGEMNETSQNSKKKE